MITLSQPSAPIQSVMKELLTNTNVYYLNNKPGKGNYGIIRDTELALESSPKHHLDVSIQSIPPQCLLRAWCTLDMEGNTWKYLLPSMCFQVLVREKIDTPRKVKLHPKIKSKATRQLKSKGRMRFGSGESITVS